MKTYFFLSILLFCWGITWGQNIQGLPPDLKFRHYTPANGLSQRSVQAILQDSKGYLWLGTRDGLNKFDGNEFTVYRHNADDPKSLSNNNIYYLYEDSQGNIWVGTQNGLNRYDTHKDNFVQYKQTENPHSITNNIVWGMIQIDENLLWIATDNGISQINITTDEIKRIHKLGDRPNSLSDNKIRSFLKTPSGNIWICNTSYIDVYSPTEKTFRSIDYPKKENQHTHINNRPTLYTDQNNTIWLGYEQGLAVYNPQTDRFIDFYLQEKKAIHSPIRSICEDHSGNLWIGTYAGLYILNPTHTNLKHIVHDPNVSTSLSQNSIYKIIRDSRGDMWLGTWADGLNYYSRDNDVFKHIPFGNTDNKLNYRVVSSLAEDKNGNLWIGTEGGGLNFYHRETKKFTYYKNEPGNLHSLSANNIKSVIIDRQGYLWIGIHDGGLNFLDPGEKPFKFQQIEFPPDQNISLKAYKVLTLFEDKNGNIWIGTLTGGLIFYDQRTQQLSKIDKDIKTVMSIVQTENPDILLVGGDKGLESIHIETKKKNKIPFNDSSKNTSSLYVNCLFIDDFGHYWIGTEGYGVYMYDPKSKKTIVYGIKEGLPNDIIYGILSDNSGNIWVSTNNGISQIDIASNSIKNYNQSDGLQGNEFNYGASFKTKNKELFFGGTNGLTYFNPKDIRKNTFVPPIHITNLEINNLPFTKITDSTTLITLKHNENNFSIDFTSLSYMRPEKNEFAYKLEGNDENWNYIGNQRRAVYTNIKPGKFIFKVIGTNNDGIWNEQGTTLHIQVLPPLWKTWWAYLLYVILCGSLFLYIRKLILLRVKERKAKERSEETNQLKMNVFTEISHEFRTPLTLIISPLEKMVDKNLGDKQMQQQHNIMLKNARMLLQLINQILDFRKSEAGKLTLQVSKNNIVPFIKEVKKSFDLLAEKRNIQYRLIHRSNDIQVWFDMPKLKNILFNLLSNAFKFSNDNSSVTIYISTSSKKINAKLTQYVKISVVNFGPVIPKERLKLIFEQFYQLDNEQKNLGSGIGLSLTKKLVEQHKGKIIVSSSEAKGNRFTVFLRLGNEHFAQHEYAEHAKNIEGLNYISYTAEEEETLQIAASIENQQCLLIVEDNLDLQNFIKEIFQHKYLVFTARDGNEALEIVLQRTIDLIISDVSMPGMDGFELCDKIKTTLITSHIPVILLTAKTSPTDQKKGYYIGADAYITKPFNVDILELQVDNLLKTRENLIRKFKNDVILKPKELTITSPDETFLAQAIAIVEENIANPDFNTGIFIDQMNMSRTVLYTKLKALTGQNLSTFIRTIRLKKAGILITQTDMNISQVVYEVGFSDLKYFREAFKELFNMTPSEYKKRKMKEGRKI